MALQVNCVGCDELPGCISMHTSVLVSKMFEEVTGLKVLSTYTICKSCQTELRSCYNFRRRCHEIFSLYNKNCEASNESVLIEEHNEIDKYPIETVKCENTSVVDEPYASDVETETYEEYILPESSDEDQSYNTQPEYVDYTDNFHCPECNKTFKKRSHLTAHQSSHQNLRQFKCTRGNCNSAFNVSARLIRHLRNVHQADNEEIAHIKEKIKEQNSKKKQSVKENVPQGKVQCEVCNKVLSNTRYLKEHMVLQHLKNSKYICKEPGCKKRFKILSLLEKHMKKHTGQVDFVCKFCGKGYNERKIFNSHLRKSHQVSESEIETLNWIVNGHVLDRKCKDCGLEFKKPHKLLEHQALEHGQGQTFICDMCGKIFTSKSLLMSHQKYHKGVKSKKCFKCPSIFTEGKGLRTHLRRVHKLSGEELLMLQMEEKL